MWEKSNSPPVEWRVEREYGNSFIFNESWRFKAEWHHWLRNVKQLLCNTLGWCIMQMNPGVMWEFKQSCSHDPPHGAVGYRSCTGFLTRNKKSAVACQPPAVKSLSIWTAFMRSHWQNTWPEGKMKTNNQCVLYRCTLNETQAHLMFFLRLYDCTNTQQIHIIDLLSQKKSIIGS